MIDIKLLEYIQKAKQQGNTPEAIKQSLIANGWQESVIDQALANPTSTNPVAMMQPHGVVIRKPHLNSPFSVMLAIILTIFLFILSNNIIADVGYHMGRNITGKLILDAIIVVPFLLLAFALHFSLGELNKKFLILSRPYYIVAGWLMIVLLFEVSKYIMDKNSAYGVYFVLILIVVVLTGMIVLAQKYLKK